MFNNVTSSWANPQQNQPQPQSGAFGQPNAFGTTAFGSTTGTGVFGQTQPPQQQQQPSQANPMFGNLGGTATSGNTGFGAFGSTSASQPSSIFGAPKPATGFGAFGSGGTGTFGGTFGQNTGTTPGTATTTTMFGQPTTTSAFGSTTAGFGLTKPSTAFGTTATTTGGAQSGVPIVTTGSLNPPYAPHPEKDGNVSLQYQTISCIPQYQNTSLEELRYQDYLQGRKTASTTGFTQPAAFGATQPTTTGLFGSQPAQQATTTPAFGSTGTTNAGFGTFGATPATTTPASTNIFGGGSTFGSVQPQQQAQPTQGFGAFGATQQPQQTGGLFGTGTFASNQPKPGGFGTFGASTGTAFGGGSAFGSQAQQTQQPQQPSGGLFGTGSTQTQASTAPTFGFGASKPLFGTQTTTQPAGGFSAFGMTSQQAQQQPAQQPLFGGGNVFGGTGQQQQPAAAQTTPSTLFGGGTTGTQTGGLFGGGGSLFGGASAPQPQPQQQPSQAAGQTGGFGLFNKPATPAGGPLFGGSLAQQPATSAPQQGLFGGSILGQSGTAQNTLGGSLFGAKPTGPATGGSTTTGQTGLFGSTNGSTLFGTSTSNAGAQGTLTASIAQPIGADLAIFDMLPPGPRLLNLEDSQSKKKPGFFLDVPTRSPVPRVQLNYTPASSKLRGFGASTTTAVGGGANSFTSGTANALSLSRIGDNKPGDILLRSASPSLGSGGKTSVKKVILDKKVEPTELFVKSGGSPGVRGGKVVFSPALSIAAREKEPSATLSIGDSPTPAPRAQRTPNRFTAEQGSLEGLDQSTELEEGDYWVKPDLATLKRTGYDELSSFKNLCVGRIGYGEIQFLEPVDLTGLSKLGALLGEVVRFDDKECSVYPDSEEVDKPPPGSGLNVRARMILYRCWAVDKGTREPIKDASHPSSVKHMKRLRHMKGTHFESFDMADGAWTFTVDHF